MIKLTAYDNREHFVERYIQDKFSKIQKKFNKMDVQRREYFKYLFPEAFTGNMLNKVFFSDLLSTNLYKVIDRYPSVKVYYEIAFFSSLDINNICRKLTLKQAANIREMYYNRFLKKSGSCGGQIIFDYKKCCLSTKDLNTYICKSSENFIEFQKFIKKNFIDKSQISKTRKRYGILKYIFEYKTMVNSTDRNEIVNNLNMIVCPYCNRAYISSFKDPWSEDEERTSADLDHFFSKQQFILFSLSLYNFVPCCKVCNSLFKGDKNMDILYPYTDAYEKKVKFTLIDNNKIVAAKDVYGWSRGKQIDIAYIDTRDSAMVRQIEREIQLFRIRDVYQIHNEFAERLLYSKNVLGERTKREILECINKGLEKELETTEFDKIYYGFDIRRVEDEYKSVPLAKLIHDIIK